MVKTAIDNNVCFIYFILIFKTLNNFWNLTVEGKVEKKYSVMVIEDDPASRILICELLEAIGIDKIVEAGDVKMRF